VSRGKRKKAQPEGTTAAAQAVVEVELSAPGRAVKQEWARLIKHVYEADPLLCPRCGFVASPSACARDEGSAERGRHADHCLHRATGGHPEDPHPSRALARPSPHPPTRGPDAVFFATGGRGIASPP
jgi:hypothetical protein